MLLPDNIHPYNSIYYNAAFIIQVLKEGKVGALIDLYLETKLKCNISFHLFVLCIDWLYLVEVIFITDNNEIKLCS